MKVQFNQSLYLPKGIINNNNLCQKNMSKNIANTHNMNDIYMPMTITIPNISFGMDVSAKFLLNQTDRLLCAYSGREMISPTLAKKIYDKIEKLPNLLSAVNYLFQYQDKYMHNIESTVFDFFNDKDIRKRYAKKTFKDVLEDYKPESLERLKEKQYKIFSKTNGLINKLSDPVKNLVTIIKNDAIMRMENGTFSRKAPLEMLGKVQTSGRDTEFLKAIYNIWYSLPSSSTDFDAFVVSYSKMSHEQICKRLISPSIATIEHVKPQSKGGSDCLSNYLLVSAEYNNNRSSLPLDEYIALHPELNIPQNMQRYINLVIREINNKNASFSEHANYPYDIAKTIEKETDGSILLDISKLSMPNKKIYETVGVAKKLSQKYPVYKN